MLDSNLQAIYKDDEHGSRTTCKETLPEQILGTHTHIIFGSFFKVNTGTVRILRKIYSFFWDILVYVGRKRTIFI